MIIEHFKKDDDSPVDYNEDNGKFLIKNRFLWFLNIGNQELDEKDLSISKINKLKREANKTTLTDYDINVLYQFAKDGFNYTKSKNEFTGIPIKQVFKGLDDAQLRTNEIMPLAYNYVKANPQDKQVMIEKFTLHDYRYDDDNLPMSLRIIRSIAIMSVIILVFYILYWLYH